MICNRKDCHNNCDGCCRALSSSTNKYDPHDVENRTCSFYKSYEQATQESNICFERIVNKPKSEKVKILKSVGRNVIKGKNSDLDNMRSMKEFTYYYPQCAGWSYNKFINYPKVVE